MKALALFAVLVFAKLLGVAGREIPWSVGTPFALFWQDALVALVFAAGDRCLAQRPVAGWALFWLSTAYAAANVPMVREFSSPLTWRMSQAAGGALSDSIWHYLTPANLALIGGVIGLAGALAVATRRVRSQALPGAGCLFLLTLALVGAGAARRVDCAGLERNALLALLHSGLPHVHARTTVASWDWRKSSWGEERLEDLSYLRGAAAGRNVVLISLESTGARSLRSYGAKEDPTPNLTRLAAESLVFENAYAVYPESIKGLFSVLCSRYPAFDTRAAQYAVVRTTSVPQVLADAGYRTALFHSGRFMYLGMNAIIQRRGFDTLEDAGAIGGNLASSFGVDEPATVQRMLAWIDSVPRGQPFFLHYLPIAGHHPYATPVPAPFPESDDAQQYLNALHYGDAALGKFLDGLRSRGVETNTLFVIYGDHGEAFGQHEGNFGHTLHLYEENIHVPLVIALPGGGLKPARIRRIASLIDVAPTLLDLLGLPGPRDFQGLSLLQPRTSNALFFTDYSLPLVGIRDGRWKLIIELGSRRLKLFDLESDPGETRNLAGQFPERVGTGDRDSRGGRQPRRRSCSS